MKPAQKPNQTTLGQMQSKPGKHIQELISKEPTSRLNANIPEDMYADFKAKAAKEKKSVTEVIMELVARYIRE